MKRLLLFGWIVLVTGQILAQNEPYWQQGVRYDLNVLLDDQRHFLHGYAEIEYINHSGKPLNELYFHLWPNAYKNRKTAFARQKLEAGETKFHFAKESERGYMDSLNFTVEGKPVTWENWEGHEDIIVVKLDDPVRMRDKVKIRTPFRVKIPESFSRLGHVGQQYQITQWYPKLAVLDSAGWHPMPYLDQGEFYGETGKFDVRITVPANYVVGATGDLQFNPKEERFRKDREEASRRLLFTKTDSKRQFERVYPDSLYKTLNFYAKKVHDFAWFCDKDYYLLTDTVKLPHSGRDVKTVTMFTEKEKKYWVNATDYLRDATYAYSLWNGDYPYNHVTAVEGALSAGAGMEYPNITIVSAEGSKQTLELTIMHEVGHNWFYGMLGTNEREHPWMDEGLNSYMENRYWVSYYKDSMTAFVPMVIQKAIGLNLTHSTLQKESYLFSAAENADQPIIGHSAKYSDLNYGAIVYSKTARAFRYLEGYLGWEVIDKCFETYFQRWRFKHPHPEMLENVFEEVSGKDLDWFFHGLLAGTEKIDFRVKRIDGNKVTIENRTGIPLPVEVEFRDSINLVQRSMWLEPFIGEQVVLVDSGFRTVELDPNDIIPELYERNDLAVNRKLFPRLKPVEFKFGYKFPKKEKATINYLPVAGYNTTDNFMPGVLFYHQFFPKKQFEFHAMPMFAWGGSNLTGSLGATYRFLPRKYFRKIELHSRTSLFSDLLRTKHFAEFWFRKRNVRRSPQQKISLNLYHYGFRGDYNDYLSPAYGSFVWEERRKHPIYSYHLQGSFGTNVPNDLYKFEAMAKQRWRPFKKLALRLRLYGAYFPVESSNVPASLLAGMSGGLDPFGEEILPDRNGNTTWLSSQILDNQGGLRSRTGLYFDQYLFTTGFTVETPVKGIEVFADYGIGKSYFLTASQHQYDVGVSLRMLNGFLYFHFPVAGSVYAEDLPADFSEFSRNISFTIHLDKLNPSNLLQP